MSDWWEKPYPGGPMVAVKGFPGRSTPLTTRPTRSATTAPT